MTQVSIASQIANRVATLTFSRPPMNSFRYSDYEDLARAITELGQRDDVRVIILASEGPVFHAGNDVQEILNISAENAEDHLKNIAACAAAFANAPVPVIAAVHAGVVGAGVIISAGCDFVIATEKAFMSIPEIDAGLVGAAPAMLSFVPHRVMTRLALAGERISAAELYAHGGLYAVVEPDELMNAATKLADTLAAKDPVLMQHWKEHLKGLKPQIVDDSFLRNRILMAREDGKEAAMAWLEKRPPKFSL